MRRLGLLVSALAVGCAAPRPVRAPARPRSEPYAEQHYAVAAREARARALEAEADAAPSMFDSVQLRVRGLDRPGIESERGVGLGARFKLERPFSMAALSEALRKEGESARFLVESARAEAEAERCAESVEARVAEARQQLGERLRELLRGTLQWTEALSQAGELSAVSLARTTLSAQRALLALARAHEPRRVHASLGELPEPSDVQQGALDRDPAQLLARIEASHPSVHAHLSAQQRYLAEQRGQRGKRLPFIDFVELGYGTRNSGLDGLSARLAVGVPLADGSRGRADKAAQLAQAEALEALGQAYTLAKAAAAALAELTVFEQQAADYRALSAAAEAAEALAARLLAERRGTPDDVAQLLDDAHDARLDVLSARERAGQAACTLAFSTGVGYARWPRHQPER